MDKEYRIMDKLSLCAAQECLIAGLMLSGTGLHHDVESNVFTVMQQELARRLGWITGEAAQGLDCPGQTTGEKRA